jgi:hypothetical protein
VELARAAGGADVGAPLHGGDIAVELLAVLFRSGSAPVRDWLTVRRGSQTLTSMGRTLRASRSCWKANNFASYTMNLNYIVDKSNIFKKIW